MSEAEVAKSGRASRQAFFLAAEYGLVTLESAKEFVNSKWKKLAHNFLNGIS